MPTATILSGESLSDAVKIDKTPWALNGEALIRIDMPAAWTAASLTFQVSDDNVTYRNLYDAAGDEYTVTADASRAIIIPPSDFAGLRWIKVRSGTAGSAVNQGADRELLLITRPM